MAKKQSNKSGNFEDFKNADLGKKKMMFVKWLMKKGVSLQEAKNICHRKFYHGDPFRD